MAIWQEHPRWKYEYFDLDTPASEFAGFEELVNMWRSKLKGRSLPCWADFDFYDFVGWHGFVEVSEYSYEPFDLTYRFFGTEIAKLYGRDLTGVSMSKMASDNFDPTLDLEFYEMIASNKYIARTSGSSEWVDREHVHVTFLELPLSDDGIRLTNSVCILKQEVRPASA